MNEPSRKEHLAWCKKRALEYLDLGVSPAVAVTSMLSDLSKHPGTCDAAVHMASVGLFEATTGPAAVRRFIEGFN